MNEHQNESKAPADYQAPAGQPSLPPAAHPGTAGENATQHGPGSFTEGLLADAMQVPAGEWSAAQLQEDLVGTPWRKQESRDTPAPAEPAAPSAAEPEAMSHILDLQLPLTIELGRTELSVAEILELDQGSIVELDKLAGEPVDVLINHQPLAKGEVVVIDDRFGIRITQLLKPGDRGSVMNLP